MRPNCRPAAPSARETRAQIIEESAVVMRALLWAGDAFQRLDVAGENGMDSVLTLHHSVDDQDRFAVGHLAIAIEHVGLDRHIDLAELVLEGEEADALGGRWSLSGDDKAGHPNAPAALDLGDLVA